MNATATITGQRKSESFRMGAFGFLKVTWVTGCGEPIEARAFGTELINVTHGPLTMRAERTAGAAYGWKANVSAGDDELEQDALENYIGNPSEALTRGEMVNFLRESMAQVIAAGGCACSLD